MVGRQSWHLASPYKPLGIYMKDPKKYSETSIKCKLILLSTFKLNFK